MDVVPRDVKILFLGTCLQSGYSGVTASATYPNVASVALRTRFPELNFISELKMLRHPKGLKALLRFGIATFKPDIVVIAALATHAATSWRAGILYELAPEIFVIARSFMAEVDAKLRSESKFVKLLAKTKGLAPQVIHPPIQLDEYERLLEQGINQCRANPCRVVLLGPGGFNEDTKTISKLQSPKLWSSVNQMVLGLGERLDVPVINAQEALHEHSSEVFLRNDHKFSLYGHTVIAREVEAVLAVQVAALLHDRVNALTLPTVQV
ncbi:MAG: hypothetical protein MSG64_11870 [Pyrinomonadaceae bacterium MAG19_C2-C3]|nr:hypothetical protein [Pyrinomonadaceae bacterium MAG19_C2-C3]